MEISKRTKLIATIGPSSEKYEKMLDLVKAGVTTIRLNFSHGDFEEHGARIENAKRMRKEKGIPVSIMLDTKGPEIRIGKMKDGGQEIKAGSSVTIYTKEKDYKERENSGNELTVSYDMSKDLEKGKIVLVDDGKLELKVDEVKPGKIIATARNAHKVKTNKRINLPGTKFSMSFLAEKDKNDIRFGIKSGIDFIAASFVNTPEDIQEIKDILKEEKAEHIKIFSKIESQYAVDHFKEIAEVTDGVMIARGDLGLEIPYYEVPVAEKMMIRVMRNLGKPVIVATQMLDSMENNPHPTRAEVTDVYLAVELGADATMLSGESAAGKYPVDAVKVMSRIAQRAEKEFYKKVYYDKYLDTLPRPKDDREEKAMNITKKVKDGEYKFVLVRSKTGQLLSKVASYRPNTNIIGIPLNKRDITQFGITSSVFTTLAPDAYSKLKENKEHGREVLKTFDAKKGDKYLVVDKYGIDEFIY